MGARVIIASGIAFSSPRITDILGFAGGSAALFHHIRPICFLLFVPTLNRAMLILVLVPSSIWTWYFIVSSSPTSRAEMQFRDASRSAELPYVLPVSPYGDRDSSSRFLPPPPSPRVPITHVVVQQNAHRPRKHICKFQQLQSAQNSFLRLRFICI